MTSPNETVQASPTAREPVTFLPPEHWAQAHADAVCPPRTSYYNRATTPDRNLVRLTGMTWLTPDVVYYLGG